MDDFQRVMNECNSVRPQGKKKKMQSIRNMWNTGFFSRLKTYFDLIITAKDSRAFNNFNDLIEALVSLCSFTINNCADVKNADDFQQALESMKKAINAAKEKKKINNSMLFQFVELEDLYQQTNVQSKQSAPKKKPPPTKLSSDFRDLPLLPTNQEINQIGFSIISPVLVKGAYESAEKYLSDQFHLLREDYVDSLRTGVKLYREAIKDGILKFRYESIRLYSGVHFEKTKFSEIGNIAYKVNFDPNGRDTTKYESSRNFMYGSLLLFTQNEFKTFFTASICHYDLDLLTSGRLYVTIEKSSDFKESYLHSSTSFTMIEADVFWEPYFLILQVLRNYSEENFPMREHLIDASTEVGSPSYLYRFREWDVFGFPTKPLDLDTWPLRAEIGLDEHQYNALQTALTKKFCVIQGPPGTGKTFLGLKIVEIILNNMDRYDYIINNPILVICFTNHALDQFLEGILPFNSRIIRVGGQSRSEILKKYNLKEKKALRKTTAKEEYHKEKMNEDERRKMENERKMRQKIGKRHYDSRNLLLRIDTLNENLEILGEPKGILSFECLSEVIEKKNKEVLNSDYSLFTWLLDEKECNISEEDLDLGFLEEMKYEVVIDSNALKTEIFSELFKTDEDEGSDNEEEDKRKEKTVTYGISVDGLGAVCLHKKKDLDSITDEKSLEYTFAKRDLTNMVQRYLILKENLSKTLVDEMLYKENCKEDISKLKLDHRWNTYFYWVDAKKKAIKAKINYLENDWRMMIAEIEKFKQEDDAAIFKTACVVGMTTTGAARYNAVLQKLKPSILIVEEAAEVLEAHIVANLSKHTQHVVLIGDHKQLKPSTAVHELSKTYNLDCSLFERMINNGMYCPTLKVQHRMRPEISSLITPSIYKKLENHESVQNYEPVYGVSKNVFFIDHTEPESSVEDSTSYINFHEAQFVLELCTYLVNLGYDPSSITLLTTYAAQAIHLKQDKSAKISQVRTCVVDEYQGEENEIIILSLVRSNREGNIGFLRTENRVCVALSRAKKGFYMIGNMSILSRASPLWDKIREKLQQNNGIDKKLTLRCKKHGTKTEVSSAADFSAVRGGGCRVKCGDTLPCTHVCQFACHIADPNHEDEFGCRLVCARTFECGHTATVICGLKDYVCKEIVQFKSTTCRHTLTRECCNTDITGIICENICKKKLACGHECPQPCHPGTDNDHIKYKCEQICGRKNERCRKNHICQRKCSEPCGDCSESEVHTLKCGHRTMLPCSTNPSKAKCPEICGKICEDCGLPCQKQCFENCRPCMSEVPKIIRECGHFVNVACSVAPKRNLCVKPQIVLKMSICGHDVIHGVPCGVSHTDFDVENYLSNCEEPCDSKLSCGHKCRGTCAQCMQGRLHIGCGQLCKQELLCGHECEDACEDLCPPCDHTSFLGCNHTRRRRRCGASLHSHACTKKCPWKCKHIACTKFCSELCNREPCYQPCMKKLRCGHPCIGFCGEPCPPICRWCDSAEMPENARCIVLEDCGCVLESDSFEDYLKESEIYVRMYQCPNCSRPIVSTQRFMNRLKIKYLQIVQLVNKLHRLGPELVSHRSQVMEKLKEFCQEVGGKGITTMTRIRDEFLETMYNKYDVCSKQKMAVIEFFAEMFIKFCKRLNVAKLTKRADYKKGIALLSQVLNHINLNVLFKNQYVMNGLRLEMVRMHKILDYCLLLQETSVEELKKRGELSEITDEIRAIIYKPTFYGMKQDRIVNELFKTFTTLRPNNKGCYYSFDDEDFNDFVYSDFLADTVVNLNWRVCQKRHFYYAYEDETVCPEC